MLADLEIGRCSPNEGVKTENKRIRDAENELEEIWEKASSFFSQGDFNEAAKLIDQILSLHPIHSQAQQLREEILVSFNRAGQFYQEIERTMNRGNLDELIGLLQEVVRIYQDHPSGCLVQAKPQKRAKRFREAMEKGIDALGKNLWEYALDWLRRPSGFTQMQQR